VSGRVQGGGLKSSFLVSEYLDAWLFERTRGGQSEASGIKDPYSCHQGLSYLLGIEQCSFVHVYSPTESFASFVDNFYAPPVMESGACMEEREPPSMNESGPGGL